MKRAWCSLLMATAIVAGVPSITSADAVTDGSLGTASSLPGPDFAVAPDLGQQQGSNLFHSFSQLDIAAAESVTFSGPASVSRIIVRITGGSQTSIDGLLRSTITGAELILINPAGFAIGSNTSLDVSGDIEIGALTAIRFDGGDVFSATPQMSETLSTADPNVYDVAASPGDVIVSSGASLSASAALYLMGGTVDVTGATVSAMTRLFLAGVGEGNVFIEPDESISGVTTTPGTVITGTPNLTAPGGISIWPANCGDGIINTPEVCDDGGMNSDSVVDACRTTCVPAGCGDGVIDAGETCDDGAGNSDIATDACRTNCEPADCGDGVIDTGEECDDADSNSDETPNRCRVDCTSPSCGDGVVDNGESCDLGAMNNDATVDGCRTNCALASCGDGVLDTGEECDNGDLNSDMGTTACRTNCRLPGCGDGVVDADGPDDTAGTADDEECDDGAENSDRAASACRLDCTVHFCGDGINDTDEDCDTGANNQDGVADVCRTNCRAPTCGDGTIDTGEACDDGENNSDTVPGACRRNCSRNIRSGGGVCAATPGAQRTSAAGFALLAMAGLLVMRRRR